MTLWKVTIERAIMTEADTEVEAVRIARRYEAQERWNDPLSIVADQVTDSMQIPSALRGEIPFGGKTDRTCAQIADSSETVEAPL